MHISALADTRIKFPRSDYPNVHSVYQVSDLLYEFVSRTNNKTTEQKLVQVSKPINRMQHKNGGKCTCMLTTKIY